MIYGIKKLVKELILLAILGLSDKSAFYHQIILV